MNLLKRLFRRKPAPPQRNSMPDYDLVHTEGLYRMYSNLNKEQEKIRQALARRGILMNGAGIVRHVNTMPDAEIIFEVIKNIKGVQQSHPNTKNTYVLNTILNSRPIWPHLMREVENRSLAYEFPPSYLPFLPMPADITEDITPERSDLILAKLRALSLDF